jgi:hypothetical protein
MRLQIYVQSCKKRSVERTMRDSIPRPLAHKTNALPAELMERVVFIIKKISLLPEGPPTRRASYPKGLLPEGPTGKLDRSYIMDDPNIAGGQCAWPEVHVQEEPCNMELSQCEHELRYDSPCSMHPQQ